MRIVNIILIVLSIFLVRCGNINLIQRNVEDYYVSTGIDKFFLQDLPKWAQFNSSQECAHHSMIKYLNLDMIMKSYNLNYSSAIQLQAIFNEEIVQNQEGLLKETELAFFRALEKINNKIFNFTAPEFKKINIIILDEMFYSTELGITAHQEKLKKFNLLMNSKVMDSAVPVLLSYCLTQKEIEKNFPDFNYKIISAEFFTPYDLQGKQLPFFQFDLGSFFKGDQKINLYKQDKNLSQKGLGTDSKISIKIINY